LLGIPTPITRALPKRLKGPREGGTPRAGRDVDTITMDVARCLHHTNGDLHDQNREVLRETLISLLAAVVDAETVFYYQVRYILSVLALHRDRTAQLQPSRLGRSVPAIRHARCCSAAMIAEHMNFLSKLVGHLSPTLRGCVMQGLHEIAAVLLLQVGQNISYHLLVSLAQNHLRDSTRQSLDAVIESLQLLYSILGLADPQLSEHITSTGLPPYFAISWVITWFAHHVSPDMVARLFDLFIASHPLMPMYLYVAGMREVSSPALVVANEPASTTTWFPRA
jgi:hypothetical protein